MTVRIIYFFIALLQIQLFMSGIPAHALYLERTNFIREQLSENSSSLSPSEADIPDNTETPDRQSATPSGENGPPSDAYKEKSETAKAERAKTKPPSKKGGREKGRQESFAASCVAGCTVSAIKELKIITIIAKPGSIITVAPGTYKIGKALKLEGVGTDAGSAPITLRAEKLGTVIIKSSALMAVRVMKPNWIIENLEFTGECRKHGFCEHAIHLIGPVSNTIIRNNRIREFNSAIKAGGGGAGAKFATDVLIEGNHIFNSTVRHTSFPVTQIDVNGGKRWKIIDNFIADFGKGQGNHTSYAGFLKSNSRDGVFARNLVICEWRHKGGERVGISFGGGGTKNSDVCEDGDCSIFHTGGLMVNNIIMNCPDVGIYLNRSKDTKVYNNTLINTKGIDARYEITTAAIENNIVLGKINTRNGATITQKNNVPGGMFSGTVEFTNPYSGDLSLKSGRDLLDNGELPPGVTDDFCGNPRTPKAAKIGAIAYGSGTCDVSARIRRALEGFKE